MKQRLIQALKRRLRKRKLEPSELESIASRTGAQISKSRSSTVLTVGSDKVRDACAILTRENPEFYHLTTVTGLDEGKTIGIFYHFWKGREFISVKTSVPKENPALDTLSDLLPSSLLYEAEVKDLLGVIFKGNPMMDRRLLLPDSYPAQAPPPLRKEADPQKIREMMGL
jgi:membrane-bound hydrogenase subunit beta